MSTMTGNRLLIHSTFVVLLPLVVAWFGLGFVTTIVLVLLLLLWRWAIVLSGIFVPEKTPDVVLETIGPSHYAEKVRWCMDRLGVEYTERQSGGTLGVFFTGRTVPQLRVRTGIVQTVIGNSPEILRYLWATNYALPDNKASFLEPTSERLDLEQKLDRYGRNLQVWIYYHLLQDRKLTLHAWGIDNPRVPAWQRLTLWVLFPLLAALIRRSFAISDEHYGKSVLHIDELLAKIDTLLADGRRSILGGDTINYTDITFAAMSGLWMQPQGYGGGKADANRITVEQMPAKMRADVERWFEDHPKVHAYAARLYAEER
ncbi:MAG: glutathione S-transferase domain-containing protein [Gammaproteobacteria bacterium]|nr:glutathione S-transferase domain-containing protein [Gammaproteobacteria bacterium]MDH3409795.1 glutathione S-transferase domain-containing protein [Gammaproteobacteria bacterium]